MVAPQPLLLRQHQKTEGQNQATGQAKQISCSPFRLTAAESSSRMLGWSTEPFPAVS
jgi:hypothetical protein